jgi:multidrug efflux pump subunit AcrB
MSYRLDPKDVLQIRVRNSSWNTVPLGSFTSVRDVTGPYRVLRYNLYPAAKLDGTPAPGYSQGQAIQTMQQLAAETLPGGLTYEWTTFQQMKASNTAVFAFVLAVVFVFLVPAAQYESLTPAAGGDPRSPACSCADKITTSSPRSASSC